MEPRFGWIGESLPQQQKRKTKEIAFIEERVRFSAGGLVAEVFLILHNVGCLLFFMGVKSAVQEASVGTIWIAGNVLWGVCAIIGRRKTYRVMHYESDTEPR